MKIKYTRHFSLLLDQIIHYWQDQLKISPENIRKFTNHINKKINLLQQYPKMGRDVTSLYNFETPTYRLTIGKSYCIFYRLDFQTNSIIIGGIYSASQVKVKF